MIVNEENSAIAVVDSSQAQVLNRTMSREELFTEEGRIYVAEINKLIRDLYSNDLYMSAWIGTLPKPGQGIGEPQGMDQRLHYEPLPDAADDGRIPWFLYWEIYVVMKFTRPLLRKGMKLLDAGGTSSLFSFYLASLGYEVHSIDLNEKLTANAKKVSQKMGWSNLISYVMDMRSLDFPDQYFDLAYSICVFEHLDYPIKQDALQEIARCLKPGGMLCITFDYRNPAPGVAGYGKDTRLRNRISTPEDIQRNFLDTELYELVGNQDFQDNGQSYLVHQRFGDGEYTFGSIFLRKIKHPDSPAKAEPVPASELQKGAEAGVDEPLPPGPFLSVIVCTYKRPFLLQKTIESLLEQSLPADRFEVIVVDNNSQDTTEEVVREFVARAPNIRYVREHKQGLSHSRNRGCNEARGDYVIYMDDDAKAHPKYLRRVLETVRAHQPDILGGPVYPYYTEPRPGWFKDEYEIRQHAKESGWSRTCSVSGSNFIIKRELLKSLGMFDPSLGMVGSTVRLGEEKAVLNRYRMRPAAEQKVYYRLDCMIYHHVPLNKMTPLYFLKRYFIAGYAKAQIERLNRNRWGLFARGRYVAKCCWGRYAAPFKNLREPKNKRKIKQFLLERAAGFMFEAGRIAGCLPSFFASSSRGKTQKTRD